MAHPHQHYQSPFGDTTLTKVFVGGLAWETPTDLMRSYFDQFGEILEAVIINDKNTGKSKGYGFVTFRDPESAQRACADPNPVIGGRRANCNVASLGRPRLSPTRVNAGRSGVGTQVVSSPLYRPLPPPPPPPPVVYPPYGYTAAYPPEYGYHQMQPVYSPNAQQTQYYSNQLYGPGAPSSTVAAPYYYGYSLQAPPRLGTFSIPPNQRFQGPPSYMYYPTQMEAGSSAYAPPPPPRLSLVPPARLSFSPSTETEDGPGSGTGPRPATSTSSTA